MARQSNPKTDFDVSVEGVGTFTFAKRRLVDEIAIQREIAAIYGGVTPTPWLEVVSGWLSSLKVLSVRVPDGWNIDELDPLDENTYATLKAVHEALVAKEASFRRKDGVGGEAAGKNSSDYS
jgi:hypothetical protein